MKKQSESKEVLDRAEWDFSAVAQVELETCLRYELAREIVDPNKYLEPPEFMDEGFYINGDYLHEVPVEAQVLTESSIVPSIVFWPAKDGRDSGTRAYFPFTPWLKIPLDDRLRTASDFELGRSAIHALDEDTCARFNFYKVTKEGDQIIPFSIRWSQSNASIADDFRQWLNENRPVQVPALVERGRQSLWDDLRCLSALRLRHVYSVEEAVNVTQKTLGKPLYTHRPAWEKACKKAIALFETVFPGAAGPKSIERKSNRKPSPGK